MKQRSMLRWVGSISICVSVLLLVNIRTLRVLSQSSPQRYNDSVTGKVSTGILRHPTGLVVIPTSTSLTQNPTVWVADTGNNVLREYTGGGLVLTIGTGVAGHVDGLPGNAEFNQPMGVQGTFNIGVNPNFNPPRPYHWFSIQVSDSLNHVIRNFCQGNLINGGTCNGVVTSAGSGVSGLADGPSLQAKFSNPAGIPSQTAALNPSSQHPWLILDSPNHAVRQWDSINVTTYAGNGISGFRDGFRTSAEFNGPTKATWDSSGNIFVADLGNRVVRKIDSAGNVTTFAGSGSVGSTDGPPLTARFAAPTSVAFSNGFIYVADALNNKIRRIDSSGNVTTYAGTGKGGLTNGALNQATFSGPTDLAIYNGVMYVTDTNNNAIRIINMSTGQVLTYAN